MAKDVRRSTIAGSWYPGSPERLGETVDRFLAHAGSGQIKGELLGLIAPHAGYQYSGQVAAYAYVELRGKEYDKVVLLAPSHRVYVGEFAVTTYAYYETPLGLVPVDSDLVAQLEVQIPLNKTDENLEHALEIQLPFLQRTLGEFSLLPILMGGQSWASCQELSEGLAKVLPGKNALLVASTDLSHFYDYRTAVELDKKVLARIGADRFSGESRGFGFVEMPEKAEAQAAISGLNGKDLKGQTLNVNEARPRAEGRRDRGDRGGGGRRSW